MQGCPNYWATGDGTGGNGETAEGTKTNAAECVKTCKEKKKTYPEINGASFSTGSTCYCEIGMTGNNGSANYKHCYFT